MNVHRIPVVLTLAIVGAFVTTFASTPLSGQSPAQASGTSGAATFATYCATCHGKSAVGDGPLAPSMRVRPANLTEIAKRNKGTFPADQIARIVDGRSPVKGHGGGEMPVWGPAFEKSVADGTPVEERIRRVVTYLEGIQVK